MPSLLHSIVALGVAVTATLVEASPQRGRRPQGSGGGPLGPPEWRGQGTGGGLPGPPEWRGQGTGGGPPGPPQWRGQGKSAGSPAYNWIFENALPIPPIAQPYFTETINGRAIQYYETTIEPFQQQVYPNLGRANLVGYNGTSPGATFMIPRGTETIIRYHNKGNTTSSVHLHGSYTHSVWDGWAFDEIAPGQYKDYYYPNTESARPMWYHDHAYGHTAADAYYGQAGCYIVTDPAEDALGLPSGKYDVPLAIADKTYQANGDLAPPNGNVINFFGDIIEVNGQPWPFLNVEPRKYRFRLFDMALSRSFDFYLLDQSNDVVPFQVIGSDSGLFASPVHTQDVVVSMGERYEIVVDFSAFHGQNITLMNGQQIAQIDEFQNTDKVMRFVVGETVSDGSNNGAVPSALNTAIQWPTHKDSVDKTFNFQMGGANTWTINGVNFSDPNSRVLARPPQGTVERWQFRHTGGLAVHPVHLHLVNMQVLSRSGGARGLMPYEAAGLKDVVLLAPGETVDVLAMYGPWNGVYMFHCHNLVHEDGVMMAAFNATVLSDLGYEFNSTQGFGDPSDSRFAAKEYDAAAFDDAARHEAVSSLATFDAYAPASSLLSAEAAYWATAGSNAVVTANAFVATAAFAPTSTAAPESSGLGFVAQTAAATSTALFARATGFAHPFQA